MSGQLEQLLTCCICLDRYRNPKLLPCQHSVCVEPCMEGLVDYVKRQVKCPECRAEHRVPYNGIQGFPANVTLQRFLDAQIEITGEAPDPHTGQFMERCNVCNEKEYLTVCAHCEKKICDGCRTAHCDVLKREIGRITNQVRRASHRLSEQLENVDRNITSMKTNSSGIIEEIENISKRLQKAIRDREDYLKSEVQNQSGTELKSMQVIHDGLIQEVENINSNVEMAETHIDDGTPWTDAELMDTKDIFLKTMKFISTFDHDSGGEYSRRTRFCPPDDLNKLASSLSNMGELNIPGKATAAIDPYASTTPNFSSGGLSRSKSDHRLAVQFREQEEATRRSPFNPRKFGERPPPQPESHDTYETEPTRRKFRSRFIKNEEDEKEEEAKNMRPRSIDTEDVARGPLSGIIRISDSPRAIQRIQEKDTVKKKPPPAPAPAVVAAVPMSTYTPPRAARQVSEDEIDKIKKQNKADDSTTATTSTTSTTPSYASSVSNNSSNSASRSSTVPEPTATSTTNGSSYDEDTSSRTRHYTSTPKSNSSSSKGEEVVDSNTTLSSSSSSECEEEVDSNTTLSAKLQNIMDKCNEAEKCSNTEQKQHFAKELAVFKSIKERINNISKLYEDLKSVSPISVEAERAFCAAGIYRQTLQKIE